MLDLTRFSKLLGAYVCWNKGVNPDIEVLNDLFVKIKQNELLDEYLPSGRSISLLDKTFEGASSRVES